MRKTAMIDNAVQPAGYYSHAVIANGFVYVSGQGPADPSTGELPSTFAGQVHQALANLDRILKGVGTDLRHAVKVNAYLSNVGNFAEFDTAYRGFFSNEPPARTTIGCQLVDIMVEIDCTAVFPEPART